MLLGRLRSEGIPAFLASELQVANQWWSGIALGGCEVQVPDEFADAARAVLQHNYREELEAEVGPVDWIHCPHCEATRYSKVRPPLMSAFAALVVIFTGIPLVPPKDKYRCRECRTVWEQDPE